MCKITNYILNNKVFVKDLSLFSHPKGKTDLLRIVEPKDFPIFALAKSGEIDLARESAFFALFLGGESGQFTNSIKRIIRRTAVFTVMFVFVYTQHKQWSVTLSIVFLIRESRPSH